MVENFTAKDVPDQTGRAILVTGANTGLGFETAKVLAGKGARVLMGCRSLEKAEAAKAEILKAHPDADLEIVEIDLGDLASVRAAAERVAAEPRLDVLVNNAGLMMPPLQRTTDGFEAQFGVNHLGPFALTGLLLDTLRETPGSRVVDTASNAHKRGRIDFDDPNAEKGYSAFGRYAMSKLANLLHVKELDRRLKAAGADTIAVAAHPGGADTELARYLPGWGQALMPVVRPFINTAAEGAWPTLAAATAPGVSGGDYLGPGRKFGWEGPAEQVSASARAYDTDAARRLWEISETMTGVGYPV